MFFILLTHQRLPPAYASGYGRTSKNFGYFFIKIFYLQMRGQNWILNIFQNYMLLFYLQKRSTKSVYTAVLNLNTLRFPNYAR